MLSSRTDPQDMQENIFGLSGEAQSLADTLPELLIEPGASPPMSPPAGMAAAAQAPAKRSGNSAFPLRRSRPSGRLAPLGTRR